MVTCAVLLVLATSAGAVSSSPISRDIRPATATASPSDRTLRLESVVVTGNKWTSEQTIFSYMRLAAGDAITPDALQLDRQRLLDSDRFESVRFFTRPGSQRGLVILAIQVRERQRFVFETGYGFHDQHGWFLTIAGLRWNNPLGSESTFRMGLRAGFQLWGVDAEWNKRFGAEREYGFTALAYFYGNDHRFFAEAPKERLVDNGSTTVLDTLDVWTEYQAPIARGGGELSVQRYFADRTLVSVGIRTEQISPESDIKIYDDDDDEFVDTDPTDVAPFALGDALRDAQLSGAFLRIVHDGRDDPYYPRRGVFGRLSVLAVGGDEEYTKVTGDVRMAVPVVADWVWHTRAGGGVTSSTTPYYDRFYTGGSYTIRGYRDWSLSPSSGSEFYWVVSNEIRWPMVGRDQARPRVTGSVFLDVGGLDNKSDLETSEPATRRDIYSALGYGVAVRVPWLGTLGMHFAVPLNDAPTGDNIMAHGTLGFSF